MDRQLRKGLLEVCILAALKKKDSYGYKLIEDISPYVDISESTLYPILRRLEVAEKVKSYNTEYNNRIRKYFSITEIGIATLQEFLKNLNRQLKCLKKAERKKYIEYYEEIISDIMESGVSEKEAIMRQGKLGCHGGYI